MSFKSFEYYKFNIDLKFPNNNFNIDYYNIMKNRYKNKKISVDNYFNIYYKKLKFSCKNSYCCINCKDCYNCKYSVL